MNDADTPVALPESVRWGVQRRLEFIDFRLLWDGYFNRKDLTDVFNISAQQASADISQYEKLAPANLEYDTTRKAYIRSSAFKPCLIGHHTDRYLLQLMGIKSNFIKKEDTWFDNLPPVEIVTLKRHSTPSFLLQSILDAIRGKLELKINYNSMSGKAETIRHIVPHTLISSAGCWYVRAWCREHDNFNDFHLSRIFEVLDLKPSVDKSACDVAWREMIDLIIIPNPELSSDKQKAISTEYGMQDLKLIIPTRISLTFYLMNEYNLDVEPGKIKADKQQIILVNRQEVEKARDEARLRAAEELKKFCADDNGN